MGSLGEVIREVASPLIDEPAIDAGLAALGAKAEEPMEECEHNQKVARISQFVRSLQPLPVETAFELERSLLKAAGALAPARREIAIVDAVSLITARNYVRYLSVCLGYEWSDGMLLQAAFSDLARRLQTCGGGLLQFDVNMDRRQLVVSVARRRGATVPSSELVDWSSDLPPLMHSHTNGTPSDVLARIEVVVPRRSS